jgi:hypothetical protein
MRPSLIAICLGCCVGIAGAADEEKTKVIWKGELHLGDDPAKYDTQSTAGMSVQIPFRLSPAKAIKLSIAASDIQTLRGDGHYVDVSAHYQADASEATEAPLATFRIKDDEGKDRQFTFDVDLTKRNQPVEPDYYSVRIRVDTAIPFRLWDDFLLKEIAFEDMQ